MSIRTVNVYGVEAIELPPTEGHRPAVWYGVLGTVCAMNDEGEARAFQYDFEAARLH